MKKILVVVVLFVLITVMGAAILSASAGTYENQRLLRVANCAQWVSLRESPSTGSTQLYKIPLNSVVIYRSVAPNGFYEVGYGTLTGYILTEYLAEQIAAVAVIDETETAILKSPENNAELAGVATPRTVLHCFGPAKNGFLEVLFGGQIGYVHQIDVRGATENDGIWHIVYDCDSFISLREEPSTSSARVVKVPRNAMVLIYGNMSGGMLYGYYGGKYGYMSSQYLKEYSVPGMQIVKATLTVDSLNNNSTVTQTIVDVQVLNELGKMLSRAKPSEFGKCPQDGSLMLIMQDGSTYSLIRVTDDCPEYRAPDGHIYALSSDDNLRFWEIFYDVYNAIGYEDYSLLK